MQLEGRINNRIQGVKWFMKPQSFSHSHYLWNFSSRVQLDISLVRCAHSLAIVLNTRREIPYLRAPMYYSLHKQFYFRGYWKQMEASLPKRN